MARRDGGAAAVPTGASREQALVSAPILALEALTKRFGGLMVLDGITLEVAPGQIHGVIGPNGAGKTTLFNVINGIYTASGGRVVFRGRDITNRSPSRIAKLGLGRTFQVPRVFNEMSLLDNMLVPTIPRRLPRRTAEGARSSCSSSPASSDLRRSGRDRDLAAARRSCSSSCAP